MTRFILKDIILSISMDRKININIKKSQEFLKKKVMVRVEGGDKNFKSPIGVVVSVIGNINDHNTEINSILYDYGFAPSFPKKVEKEANKITENISGAEIKNRLDLRKTCTFTIDPKDAFK